jgi:hypothetical protein
MSEQRKKGTLSLKKKEVKEPDSLTTPQYRNKKKVIRSERNSKGINLFIETVDMLLKIGFDINYALPVGADKIIISHLKESGLEELEAWKKCKTMLHNYTSNTLYLTYLTSEGAKRKNIGGNFLEVKKGHANKARERLKKGRCWTSKETADYFLKRSSQ